MKANYYRDFNILNNTYKEFNKEKQEVDKLCFSINAAKDYFKTRGYDLIQGKHLNDAKEEDIKYKQSQKYKNIPEGVKGYNINSIYNNSFCKSS